MRNIPVNAGGKIVRVGDVAEVTRGYIDPATFVIHHEGEPALILGVVMRKNFNGLTLGEALGREEAAIQAELPVGIALSKVSSQPLMRLGLTGPDEKKAAEGYTGFGSGVPEVERPWC